MTTIKRAATLAALALCAITLSACVVAPYPQRVYSQPVPVGPSPGPYYSGQEDVVMVDVPPPAPYVEVVPAMPFAGAFWIGGYWGWHGGRHNWVPGRWEHARPGYGWRSPAWVNQGGRWALHGGGWVRR